MVRVGGTVSTADDTFEGIPSQSKWNQIRIGDESGGRRRILAQLVHRGWVRDELEGVHGSLGDIASYVAQHPWTGGDQWADHRVDHHGNSGDQQKFVHC